MNEDKKANLLENSLERLLAGELLENILADTPHEDFDSFEAELVEARDAARLAALLTPLENSPTPGQTRNKAAFLAAAAGQRKALRKGRWAWLLAPARLAPVMAVFVAALVFTGIASAQALPGDSLYSVKLAAQRTRILITIDPVEKVALEMHYNQERLSEFELMIEHDRDSEVTFSGFVRPGPVGSWYIETIRLEFPPGIAVEKSLFDGAYVQVHGVPAGANLLLVEDLRLRVEKISGVVETLGKKKLRVDNREVVISTSTRIDGNPVVGSKVEITAALIDKSLLEAISIRVIAATPGGGLLPDEQFDIYERMITTTLHIEDNRITKTPEVETKEVLGPTDTPEPKSTQIKATDEPDPEPDSTPSPEPAIPPHY